MNSETNAEMEIQSILKKKFLKGPRYRMENNVGINTYSGNQSAAYYELWGETQVFRLIIIKVHSELYAIKYLGKQHLFLLLEEEQEVVGGFVSIKEDLFDEIETLFPDQTPKGVRELNSLWKSHVYQHYLKELFISEV